jgi:hypothetical protein
VTTGSALSRLSEPRLRAWILARMRGAHEDPPVVESRLESPDDYVLVLHHETKDGHFRARIEKATLTALGEVAACDLRTGPDARALLHLAALVERLELRAAAPILQTIAERGALGGQESELEPDAEAMVLFALAGLQEQKTLWSAWKALWQREIPRLWPVVTSGMRLSDSKKALGILPTAVERAASHAELPLGEVLWASDEHYKSEDIAGALQGLSPQSRERCREALRSVGAQQDEIDAWVPVPAALLLPAWARRSEIKYPPRIGAPACL